VKAGFALTLKQASMKNIARDNYASLFNLIISEEEENNLNNIDINFNVIKCFSLSPMLLHNKLESLSLASVFKLA
jgi:hypothetical protein